MWTLFFFSLYKWFAKYTRNSGENKIEIYVSALSPFPLYACSFSFLIYLWERNGSKAVNDIYFKGLFSNSFNENISFSKRLSFQVIF